MRHGVGLGAVLTTGTTMLVVSWAATRLIGARWGTPPTPSWTLVAVLVLVALGTTMCGRTVRRDRDRGPWRRSVRVLGWAQACAVGGAVIGGACAGHLLTLIPDLDVGSVQSRAWRSGAATVVGGVVCLAGLWTQRTCRAHTSGGSPG